MSNCLDLDQDRCSVGPDLGPNCLQTKVISRRQTLLLLRKELKQLIIVTGTLPSTIATSEYSSSYCTLEIYQWSRAVSQSVSSIGYVTVL